MSDIEAGGFVSDPSLPYIQLNRAEGEPVLFAPAREDDPAMANVLARAGLQRFVSLDADGVVGALSLFQKTRENPYAEALLTIGVLESSGGLPEGSHHEALQALIDEEFDTSPWARYLPRPDDA